MVRGESFEPRHGRTQVALLVYSSSVLHPSYVSLAFRLPSFARSSWLRGGGEGAPLDILQKEESKADSRFPEAVRAAPPLTTNVAVISQTRVKCASSCSTSLKFWYVDPSVGVTTAIVWVIECRGQEDNAC